MPASPSTALAPAKPPKKERLRDLLPDIIAIMAPRRGVLISGFFLITSVRIASLAPALAMKSLYDEVIGKGHADKLPKIIAVILGASIYAQAVGFILQQLFSRSTTRMIGELRCKLHQHLIRLSLTFHDENRSGNLAARVMNDIQGLQNLVGTGLLSYVGSLMTSIVALVFMAQQSLRLTVIAVFALIGIGGVIALGTSRIRDIAIARNKIYAEIMGRLVESLSGVRVVKAYRAEEREESIFAANIQRLVDNTMRSVNLNSGLNISTGFVWAGASAFVMYAGISRILAGKLTLGEFGAFMWLLGIAVAPLASIVGFGGSFMEAIAGLERSREILGLPREDLDDNRTVTVGRLRGEVEFEGVNFAYKKGKPILHDVSFRADPGTVTALVGPSGSGKSTTIGLVSSFYKPTGGHVTVDGIDLSTVKIGSYRSQLGVVLQETFLFAGTIIENVAFARPGASEAEILAACRTARVDEFADKFEHKYDTIIGERGIMLSGGQRQRISIARALLADPRILILDEATSSLDTHSEALIQEGLAHLVAGRTTFVIAHRLSTIRKADQILVVSEGRIVERGTHAELLAANGLYGDMYTKQHQLEDDLFLAPGEGGVKGVTVKPQLSAAAIEDPVGIIVPS